MSNHARYRFPTILSPVFNSGRRIVLLWVVLASVAAAGPVDRVLRPVDPSRTTSVPGNVPRLAQAQFDRGAVDDGMRMEYMVLLMKPSAAQQADLDQLLAGQQILPRRSSASG